RRDRPRRPGRTHGLDRGAVAPHWHPAPDSASLGWSCCVLSETNAGQLPALFGLEEVAIAGSNVGARGERRPSSQHHLATHELPVVLRKRALGAAEAWIGCVRAGGPLPHFA